MSDELEIVQGTLDLMVLRALEDGRKHGYTVMEWIRTRAEDELRLEDAALYPALHRLEARGLIESDWGRSENNRRAKFYSLTESGRSLLAERTRDWFRYARLMARLLPLPDPDRGGAG